MNDKCLICNEHAEEGHDCAKGVSGLFKEIFTRLACSKGYSQALSEVCSLIENIKNSV